MSKEIASKWNSRYSHSGVPMTAPSAVLSRGFAGCHWARMVALLARKIRARHLIWRVAGAANGHWLAQRGFSVSAWDISDTVIDEIRQRKPQLIKDVAVRDVIADPPEPRSFNVIVVSRFLHRKLCPAIADALKPGGVLFYQTFTHGLSNADYLLGANELLSLFSDLQVLEYHEPLPDESGKAEARLIARRRSR